MLDGVVIQIQGYRSLLDTMRIHASAIPTATFRECPGIHADSHPSLRELADDISSRFARLEECFLLYRITHYQTSYALRQPSASARSFQPNPDARTPRRGDRFHQGNLAGCLVFVRMTTSSKDVHGPAAILEPPFCWMCCFSGTAPQKNKTSNTRPRIFQEFSRNFPGIFQGWLAGWLLA